MGHTLHTLHAVHFCSDAANEAMDEWKTGTGVNTTARNTEPQNKSLRIADHCTRQNKVLSAAGLVQRRPRIEASSNFLYYKTEPSSQCREKNSHHMHEPQTLVCSIAAHGWKLAHFFQPSFH